jgi:alpha/beta superfamily hydrolase
MPEVVIPGPVGRLEGRYNHSRSARAPIALCLQPHPAHGGTMNNRLVYSLFHACTRAGFSVLRFNFRGVGKSQGSYGGGEGELADAASALDWLQTMNPNAREVWVGGFSFGAYVAMQLLMRRPEIDRFISIAPPANMFDFGFLAPCPSSGIIVQGGKDTIVPIASVDRLVDKLKLQKDITVDYHVLRDAGHFFNNEQADIDALIDDYIARELSPADAPARVAV